MRFFNFDIHTAEYVAEKPEEILTEIVPENVGALVTNIAPVR